MFCPKCGNELPDDAKFCAKCGNKIENAGGVNENPADASVEPESCSFAAAEQGGEAVLGSLGGSAGTGSGIGKVISDGFGYLISSVKAAFKDPKRLIPAFILAGVWLITDILLAAGVKFLPVVITSFLTFAGGGMYGGVVGAVGGLIGKGIFAGAVTSVIGLISRKGGEKRTFSDIVKGAFGADINTLWAYLAGIGAALILYVFISGGATRGSGVLAAAAAYLSARAALSGGFLQSLFGSVLSKIKGTAAGSAQGIIRGLAAGFAASALIGYVLPRLVFIIAGLVLLAGGIVMMILQAKGVVKLGKEGARA